MIIKLLVEGGKMQPGPALSQKIGPLGINAGQIIQKVNEATKDFTGLKVPVELDINPSTKEFNVRVFSPPVSELIKKELGIEKGSGQQKDIQVGNLSIEQIIGIAKQKMQNLLANDLKAAVKMVIGTCASLGVLVENKPANEIQNEIDEGIYDKQIKDEISETPEEKKKELNDYFEEVKKNQEALVKKLEQEKQASAKE